MLNYKNKLIIKINKMITLIAAIANNNAIGKNNQMLWHLPNDFKHFKNKTSHHIIIMGRKTFESLPGVLPNRKHIIITRQKNYETPQNCEIYHSLHEAINAYKNQDLYIIGGGEIYTQALPLANKLELTFVDVTPTDADAFFPEVDLTQWELVEQTNHQSDSKHKYDYSFKTYIKK